MSAFTGRNSIKRMNITGDVSDEHLLTTLAHGNITSCSSSSSSSSSGSGSGSSSSSSLVVAVVVIVVLVVSSLEVTVSRG